MREIPDTEKKMSNAEMRSILDMVSMARLDRGKMWRITAEESGMTLDELWVNMNQTNDFIGAAPFYGGDAKGLAEFVSL